MNATSCFWHTWGLLKRHLFGMKLVFVIVTANQQRVSHAKNPLEPADLFVFLAGMRSSLMDTVWRNFAKPLARPNISQPLSLQRLLKAEAYQVIKHLLLCIHVYITICTYCCNEGAIVKKYRSLTFHTLVKGWYPVSFLT